MHQNVNRMSMHYSGYMVLTLAMVVVFFLGMLIVEIPFAAGLGYFHDLQRNSVISKKMQSMQVQYQKQISQVQVAGFETDIADECGADFDDCSQTYKYELQAGFITNDEWAQSQGECEAMRDECLAPDDTTQ